MAKSSNARDIFFSSKILIVDDDPLIINALTQILSRENFPIEKALDGKSAIEKIKTDSFAVILCDVRLNDMSGLEVLKEAIVHQPDVPRIALTGLADAKMMAELINYGKVSEFINKPWETVELVQVVKNCFEKSRLIAENKSLHELILAQNEELRKSHQKLSEEIQIGALIHRVMLTGEVPHLTPGLNIQALTIPSKEIDGDFFDFYQPIAHLLDIVIGDVMGKGLPAALVGIAVKGELTRFAIPNRVTKIVEEGGFWQEDILTPSAVLSKVLEKTADHLMRLDFFVTLIYARFNIEEKVLSLVDCGSTKPLHYRSREKRCVFIKGSNFPLGFTKEEHYVTQDVAYFPNDLFVFYSDGLTEAFNPSREMFGTERLIKLVEENHHLSSNELVEIIRKRHQDFTRMIGYEDDFSLIIVRIEDMKTTSLLPKIYTGKFFSALREIQNVRKWVSQCVKDVPGEVETFSSELSLAVNEIFSNIVKHGMKGDEGQEIIIRSKRIEHGVAIEIADQGESFDPSLVEEPSLKGYAESGFGLYMVKKLIDEISYTSKSAEESGWNRFELIKYFKIKEESMQLSHYVNDHILTIVLEGDNLDARESSDVKIRIKELIQSTKIKQIVMDLHHIQFIDSSGLGCFLSILRLITDSQGELILSSMTKPVRAVFELVNMHKIFEIYPTNQDAISALKGR